MVGHSIRDGSRREASMLGGAAATVGGGLGLLTSVVIRAE
jgi:hypothetical protein